MQQLFPAHSNFTMDIRIFSPKDPYIYVQKVTNCWLWFGMTASTKASLGIGLLVTGLIITAFVIGLIFFLFKKSNTYHVSSTPSTAYNNPAYHSSIPMQEQKASSVLQGSSTYGYPLPNPLLLLIMINQFRQAFVKNLLRPPS